MRVFVRVIVGMAVVRAMWIVQVAVGVFVGVIMPMGVVRAVGVFALVIVFVRVLARRRGATTVTLLPNTGLRAAVAAVCVLRRVPRFRIGINNAADSGANDNRTFAVVDDVFVLVLVHDFRQLA